MVMEVPGGVHGGSCSVLVFPIVFQEVPVRSYDPNRTLAHHVMASSKVVNTLGGSET